MSATINFCHAAYQFSTFYKPIKLTVIQHKGYEYDNQEIPNILLSINGNIFTLQYNACLQLEFIKQQ